MEPVSEGQLVTSFVEFTGGDEAVGLQLLQATNWKLEDAVNLFFAGAHESMPAAEPLPAAVAASARASTAAGAGPSPLPPLPAAAVAAAPINPPPPPAADTAPPHSLPVDDDFVRAPLPVRREALNVVSQFGPSVPDRTQAPQASLDPFRNFQEDAAVQAVIASGAASGGSSAAVSSSSQGLSALYRPPFEIMFKGSFDQAKAEGSASGKWLLVNLLSTSDFSSHMMNRDTWSDEFVKATITNYFVFLQVNHDAVEGRRLCTFYKITDFPATMVLDPVTGHRRRLWTGMRTGSQMLEDLMPFMDHGPTDGRQVAPHPKKLRDDAAGRDMTTAAEGNSRVEDTEDEELQRALAASLQGRGEVNAEKREESETYENGGGDKVGGSRGEEEVIELPPEPSASEKGSCRIAFRCPDGQRLQRRFLTTDPVKLLGAYCRSQLKDSAQGRALKLSPTVPGSSPLDLSSSQSISEAGVANSMLALSWL